MIKNIFTSNVKFSHKFEKQLSGSSNEIIDAFFDTLTLFLENSNHPFLRNHTLKKNFAGFRSIDVTEDVRALYKESLIGDKIVITFYLIGTHSQLYGK